MSNTERLVEGDLVWVEGPMPSYMSHFRSGCKAIIANSDGSGKEFGLLFEDGQYSAWYYRQQLTLLSPRRIDLLELWEH